MERKEKNNKPRLIIVNLLKTIDKEKILKTVRGGK